MGKAGAVVGMRGDIMLANCVLMEPEEETEDEEEVIFNEPELTTEVISNNTIYDENFRSDELIVDFELLDLMLEDGQGVQIRLETDQLRDWHKPFTEWIMPAPPNES